MTTGQSALRRGEAAGWRVIENGPDRPRRRVLMLPGLFCIGEMHRNPRAANRAMVVGFFEHIAANGGEVASLLATSSTPVWLGRGDRDEVGMSDAERAILEAAPHVRCKTIPDAAHFSITDAPHEVAQIVIDLLACDET